MTKAIRLFSPVGVMRLLVVGGCIVCAATGSTTLADSITTTGRTDTTVVRDGSVIDISTNTVHGINAFNEFGRFNVAGSETVNLFVPDQAQNLLNLVRDESSTIDGMINAWFDGQLGGNVFFLNPHGIVVGQQGKINVGSLTLVTPTQAFMDEFFDAALMPNAAATLQVLEGQVPLDANGLITVHGHVLATDSVDIDAGNVNISGSVRAGGTEVAVALSAANLINLEGMDTATYVEVTESGSVRISAAGDMTNSGLIAAHGGAVSVEAGNRIALEGGAIDVGAQHGSTGSVELSTESIEITGSNLYTGGDDWTMTATDSLTVGEGVVISTRDVANVDTADHQTADSIGDSGNLTINAPVIALENGAALYAHAINDGGTDFSGGDVTLSAIRDDGGNASVSLNGNDVRGENVTLEASVSSATDVFDVLVFDATAMAQVSVTDTQIIAADTATIAATATIDAQTGSLPLPVSSIDANAAAIVVVAGATVIETTRGAVALTADTSVTTNATPNSFLQDLAGDVAVGRSDITSVATVHVGDSSAITSGGAIDLIATNVVDATAVADASAAGDSAAGAAVAVSVIDATTSAYVDGSATINAADTLTVKADSTITSQAMASAATQGASEDTDGDGEAAQTLTEYSDESSTSDGGVEVAGAVAVGDVSNSTQAYLASSAAAESGGLASIEAYARESSTVSADGSAAAGSVGVGVGVAINIGDFENHAFIDQDLTAVGISVLAGDGADNVMATTATAGAGASDVGVAGALALNVIDDIDSAEIRSGTLNAGGGNFQLASSSNTSSTASATPVEDGGATGESVGFGASVAMNIIAHDARATVASGVNINGASGVTLSGLGRHDVTTTAEAGAEGGVAVTPVLALADVDNQTVVRLDSGTPLNAAGPIDIRADHRGVLTTTATGNTDGETAAVGGAFAITTINDTALARVDREISSGAGVTLEAINGSVSSSVSTASTNGGDDDESGDDDEGGVDQAIGRQQDQADMVQASNNVGNDDSSGGDEEAASAETSEGKLDVAAAVSVNTQTSSARAELTQLADVTAAGNLRVTSSNNTDGTATADASAVGGDAAVGIGAAVAINRVVNENRATVGSGTIDAAGLTVEALMTELDAGDMANTTTATSMSGAGGSNVGVAGSLALNNIDTQTLAEISDGTMVIANGQDIVVMANLVSELFAMATPTEDGGAEGGKVGVGASVALNLGGGQSSIGRVGDNVTLSDAASLGVAANGSYDVTTEAKAGAEGGVALDAVVALAVLDETTEASVGEGDLIDLSGGLAISAESSGTRKTSADADIEAGSVGVGAAAAVVTSTSRTRALLARDVTTVDALSVSASSDRRYDTMAKAGARGADMESVEEPSERRDNTTSTNTLDNTSDAQRGGKDGGKVSVAAAVAVSDIDDDVEASVTGGRRLSAGGDITVSATNASNFSSRGRGDAVDSSVAVGIGVGVGLSIAHNDTLASLDDGTYVLGADGMYVLATSTQNTADDYINRLAAEAIAGAGARRVGVAGAFGVAFSESTTRASVGQITVDNASEMIVAADNTSKLSAKAWAGAMGRVGVGASVATIYSDNEYAATIAAGSDLTVGDLAVTATNHVVDGEADLEFDIKDFDSLTENNLQLILGTNNYYTEALAGTGGNGVAVSGAFAVNIFNDMIRAQIEGPDAGGMATTIDADGSVTVASNNEVRARSFAGALAAASKVGVGVSTADIANTTRSISSMAANVSANDVSVVAVSDQDFGTFGVSGSGAGNTGASGAVNVIVSENEVAATIEQDSEVMADNNVLVTARNDIEITNIAGGAAGGGTAGIGISSAVNVINNMTTAQIGRDATVDGLAQGASMMVAQGNAGGGMFEIGGVAVTATAAENLFTIAAGGGGGGSAGIAGSGAVNVLGVSTLALIAEGAIINSEMLTSNEQSVYVLAADHTDSFTVAGAGAGGGSAGVGAGADVSVIAKDTQAYIAAADVRARGNVAVAARSSEDLSSIAATVGIGGSAGVAGSAGVHVVDITTRAFIGQDDVELAMPTVIVADGSVTVEAQSATEMDLLAGGVSGGGSAGIGASAAVAVIDKTTEAFIGANSNIQARGELGPVEAATGRFAITRVVPTEEEGEVGPAGGDNNADLTGDGNDQINNEALTTERVASAGRDAFSGVAVTATNQDDISTIAASGGGAGSVAVNISGSVVVLDAATTARIAEGATVNAAVEPGSQGVRVAASNDFQRLGIAAAASVAGAVGVTPGADITVATLNTLATIDNNTSVSANGDVEVLAASSQDVLSVAAGAAGSGTVAVGGAVSVVNIDSQTHAQVGADAQDSSEAAVVDADGNVLIVADDRTESLMVAGSLGVGIGAAGIGGSVGVTNIDKDTRALVGNFANVTARGQTSNVNGVALMHDAPVGPLATRDDFSGLLVQATSLESIESIAAAAAAGFYAGLGGGVSIQSIDSDTFAAIGSDAVIDAGDGMGSEQVMVAAANQFDSFGFGGGIGGGLAGIGGGVDIGTVRNDTSASVGANSSVDSSGDLVVLARADKDVHSIAASAAGGGFAVAGSVSVWSLGTASDDGYSVDETDQETGTTRTRSDAAVDEEGFDSTTAHVDDQNTQFAALLDGYNDPDMNADAMAGLQTAMSDISGVQAGSATAAALADATPVAGTSATVGADAALTAGDNLWVSAADQTAFRVDAGTVSVGGTGIGAAIAVANFQNSTTAIAGPGATLAAGDDADDQLWFLAAYDQSVNGLVAAGTAGGTALGAQVLVVNDSSTQNAILADDVSVTGAAGGVTVDASGVRNASLDSAGASIGSVAAGVAVAVADFSGGSTTRIGAVDIGSTSAVGDINISASLDDLIDVETASVAAGALSLTGSFAVANSAGAVNAVIEDDATIMSTGDIELEANSRSGATATATGVVVSGVAAGGASVALATASPNVTATVGRSVTLDAGEGIAVRAFNNTDENGVALANVGAQADAYAGAGALGIGAAGAIANAESSGTVLAAVTDTSAAATMLSAGGSIEIVANALNRAASSTVGVGLGALAVGISLADAVVGGSTQALLAANRVSGDSISVTADSVETATAETVAGAGGIVAGSGAVATATTNAATTAVTGDGAELIAANTIAVTAAATADADARSTGINAGALAVGVSSATASTTPNVEARLGDDTQLNAQTLELTAERRLAADNVSASANATGSSGGLVGVNATESRAEDAARVLAQIGDRSELSVSGMATVDAINTSRQDATSNSFTAGIIAAGANLAVALSTSNTIVRLGDAGTLLADQLRISARGSDTNYADSTAGSGGVISGSAATAATNTQANALADTGSTTVVTSDFSMNVTQDANFDSRVNSVNASLLGASGARANNTSNTTATARLGASGTIMADNLVVEAVNNVTKTHWGSGNGWNISSGSGGAIDAPAARTRTTINSNALVDVGSGATIVQLGDRNAPGIFTLDASNNVTAYDRVQMNSGGAVAIAKGQSQTIADSVEAAVVIGDSASLNAVGDIRIGTRTSGTVRNAVAVDTYGLAGAPEGLTTSTFRTVNRVDVQQNAALNALRDILIGAGVDTSDTSNSISTRARTDLWNNTVIPISGQPDADAIVETTNSINVAAGAELAAVRDARLSAVRGNTSASGVGIAKDIYREALAAVASAISEAFGGDEVSFDIHGGSRRDTSSGTVTVDGAVRVGTQSRLELTFNVENGNVVEERRVNGVIVGPDEGIQTVGSPNFIAIAQDILDRIDALYDLIGEYNTDEGSTSAGIAVRAYESEIAFLERKLEDLGYPVEEDPVTGERRIGFSGVQDVSPQEVANQRIANMNEQIDDLESQQEDLRQDSAMREDQNLQLGADNIALAESNVGLEQQNTVLNANIAALMMQQAGLDPNSDEYAALQMMIDQDQAQIDANNDTIAANVVTINGNTMIIDQNVVVIMMNDDTIMNLDGEIMVVNTNIMEVEDGGPYSTDVNGGPVGEFREIDDVIAQLGNIYIDGTDLRGSGRLEAPGNALISIVNNTPVFLTFNDLIIPSNSGGKLFVNSVDVTSNAAINSINRGSGANFSITTGASAGAEAPAIVISSSYDPLDATDVMLNTPTGLPPLAPDVIVSEGSVISNVLGSVTIDMAAGNIRIEEDTTIAGQEINIQTRNGDFVQSYTEGFTHVAGDPLGIEQGDTDGTSTVEIRTPTGAGILANGSVLLSGRYLNINGTIQSGIPEWGLVIPAQAAVTSAFTSGLEFASFDAARDYYATLADPQPGEELFRLSDPSALGLPGGTQGERFAIGATFNALENRIELNGVQVQGGYIELFGQIFNTGEGVGQLRVLDGFGQIRVDNQSGLDLMLNVLDVGRGARGEIRITNILDDGSVADPVVFTRGPGDPRTGQTFDPETGLRYDTIAGRTEVVVTSYIYSQSGWFGVGTGAAQLGPQYIVAGPNSVDDPLSTGSYLRLAPSITGEVEVINQMVTTSDSFVAGASWRDCNWWTLCANSTHYRQYLRTQGNTVLNGYSLLADYGIDVQFIGFDQGLIDVASNGNVLINGSINNPGGATTIASDGDITQLSETGILTSQNINLLGGTLGAADQPLRIAGLDGGVLNASALTGNLYFNQLTGVLNVGQIAALNGMAVLSADDDILGGPTSLVSANRIELTSRSGGIGSGEVNTADNSLAIQTTSTTSLDPDERARFGLVASARDNVKIAQAEGDLMVIDVQSTSGDVRLQTAGSIVDNNPVSRIDERTEDELIDLWDSMRLRGELAEDKAADEIFYFENAVTQDYRTYWTQRNQQADPTVYDPGYVVTLSAAEESAIRDQLAAQERPQAEIDALIASYADDRTAEYHRLHERLYDPASADALGGDVPGAFDAEFRYVASQSEVTARTTGSSWEQFQLELPVAAGLLKEITDTVTEVKDPNIRGRNIVLDAGANVGFNEAPLTIDLSLGLDALDRTARAAIAAAERSDVTVNGSILEVVKRTPVNIEQTGEGSVRVEARNGYAYIGSEGVLYLDQVLADGDVRIKVAGALFNAGVAGEPNVLGDTIILEAAQGNIGTDAAPIGIELGANGAFVARAADAIYAETTAGDFRLDTLFSRGDVFLTSGGSIIDAFNTDDLNLLGSSIYLEAAGSIGEDSNPLDVGNDPQGLIEATSGPGEGIFLNVPEGNARFGALMSGGVVNLSSAVGYTLDGMIQAPGSINLSAVRNIDMSDNAAVVSSGDLVSIIAGSLTMAEMARIDAQGNLIIEVVDREIDNPDGTTTTIPGGAVISTVSAGNDVNIAAGSAGVSISGELTAGNALALNTSGALTGTRIESGGDTSITAGDDVELDELVAGDNLAVAGGAIDVDNAQAGASIALAATSGDVRLGGATAANDLAVDSAGAVSFDTLDAGGRISIAAVDDVGGNMGSPAQIMAGELDITSSAGAIGGLEQRLDVMVSGDVALAAQGDIGVRTPSGNLMASRVTSESGSVDLLVENGAALLGTVSAREEIIIQATTALAAEQIDGARTIELRVTDEGGRAEVGMLGVGNSLSVNADVIDLPDVMHLEDAQPLKLDLSGNDGGMAQRIDIAVDSDVGVDFINFRTLQFDMSFSADAMSFDEMQVGEFGRLVTPRHNIVIDNVNRVLDPDATAQLYALNESFDLTTTDQNLLFTTARIINYDPFFIVNQFSTENSLVRLLPKRMTLWERIARQMTAVPRRELVADDEELVDFDPYGAVWIDGAAPAMPLLD